MHTFKQFLNEDIQEIPFEHNPKIGWWRNSPTVTLYHGTHIKNLENIKKAGVNVKDKKTGMISFSLDPHTSHGYSSMSGGEANFRSSEARAEHVPHNQRVVVQYNVPRHWIEKHIDSRLGGNLNEMGPKMKDKSLYEKHLSQNGPNRDSEYYGTSEIRLSHPIPNQYMAGYMRKVK